MRFYVTISVVMIAYACQAFLQLCMLCGVVATPAFKIGVGRKILIYNIPFESVP